MSDFIDAGINGDFLVINQSQFVIAETRIAKGRGHKQEDDDKKWEEDNRLLEERSREVAFVQIDGSAITIGNGDDLSDAFINQAHTKGNNDRRKLREDKNQGMEETKDHAEDNGKEEEEEDFLHGDKRIANAKGGE